MNAETRELRERMNPQGLNLADVIVQRPGIQKGWLKLFQPRGAGRWNRTQCWLVLGASGAGLAVAMWAAKKF